ncbi:hypothetical protein M422DRAFT_242854 [Sphaerobolus stellatus SS14]|nr:hypothetical protein M422DRAFT_242854 [Sphaerobolus stellatus SS14]
MPIRKPHIPKSFKKLFKRPPNSHPDSKSSSGPVSHGIGGNAVGGTNEEMPQPAGMESNLHEHSTSEQQPSPAESPDRHAEVAGAVGEATNALLKIQLPDGGVPSTLVQPGVDGISTMVNFWEPLLDKVKVFASLVDKFGEIHPYAKMASMILLSAVKPILAQNERDNAMQELLKTIYNVYDYFTTAERLSGLDENRRKLLQRMSQQTVECAYYIRDQSKVKKIYLRATKNALSGTEIDKKIKGYIQVFDDLKRAFTERGVLETEITTLCILEKVEDNDAKMDLLLDLTLAPDANRMPLKGYLPGTRIGTLDLLTNWINDINNPRVLFLIGGAGMGKSAIAHAIAERFEKLDRQASFFRFNRSIKEDRQLKSVFSTIARNLALWHSSYRRELTNIYKLGSFATMDIESQWNRLLIDPARRLHGTISGPVLIVLDALDESGTPRSRKNLLSFLTEHVVELPSNFRIIVTSRPESDILNAIHENLLVDYMDLNDRKDEAKGDIDLYIRDWLKKDSDEYLEDSDYQKLCNKADGLFQWAFTACKFMVEDLKGGLSLKERLQHLLDINGSALTELDGLYSFILSDKLNLNYPNVKARYQSVMAQILSAAEPLSISSLHKLRSYANNASTNEIKLIVQEMSALLIGAIDNNEPIQAYHTSFRDFLTTKERSGVWYVDVDTGNLLMAHGCFSIIYKCLCFNIGDLPSSFLSNDEMLCSAREKHAIPSPLKYACLFWQFHLKGTLDERLCQQVIHFAKEKLLFWFEALSILQSLSNAVPALATLVKLLGPLTSETDTEIGNAIALLQDAIKFVRYIAPAIGHSAPHIYISGLTFAPQGSIMKRTYTPKFNKTMTLQSGQLQYWPAQQGTLPGHTYSVQSVAFSPDGKCIASGSEDNTIWIWDAETGENVGEPLKGHTSSVWSVAFSPDGKRIASGSEDNTIRIWDAETGENVGEPLKGHTYSVWSVAFSPDGKHIASGSEDNTIRIWDAETGKNVGEPLKGHTSSVRSVAFSPDGKHIASGSEDNTIRIWDAETGENVGEPLKEHTSWVWSVAFSPDGKRIASGSYDNTIRIWDAETGENVGEPLKGHMSWVLSVAFSPDGKCIASGSYDNTIRIWDAETGENVGEPLKGHTSWVLSVAFSPDGKRIASGSYDNTIRIWDAETGENVGEPQKGHTSSVLSVVFSPDGKHIASGSYDNTIRIWDAETGENVGEPLKGHTSWVLSVAFSPDGKRIASGSDDNTIWIWDAETEENVGEPLKGHTSSVRSVAFSPDGKCIASGSEDNTIRIWDAETGENVGEPLKGHTSWVWSAVFSPDGKHIASGSDDKTIRIWDAETGENVGEPLKGHTAWVRSAVFSPDGKHIASGSDDKTIRIWDAETGENVGEPLKGHTSWVRSVAFSPDGKYIASGSDDSTIWIWDAETGKNVGEPQKEHVSLWSFITDQATIHHNGWVYGMHDELLLWVPPLHRLCLYPFCLHWSSALKVIGSYEAHIELTNTLWGMEWTGVAKT